MRAGLLLLLWLALTGPASAATEPAEVLAAQQLAEAALTRYESQRFAEAALLYERAFALNPDPTLLYNMGRSQEKAGDRAAALACYRRFLAHRDGDAALRARAGERVRSLAPPPPPPPHPPRGLLVSGVTLGALGLLGLGAGAGIDLLGQQRGQDAATSFDEFEKRRLLGDAHRLGVGAVVAYALGGALVVTGGALLIAHGRRLRRDGGLRLAYRGSLTK